MGSRLPSRRRLWTVRHEHAAPKSSRHHRFSEREDGAYCRTGGRSALMTSHARRQSAAAAVVYTRQHRLTGLIWRGERCVRPTIRRVQPPGSGMQSSLLQSFFSPRRAHWAFTVDVRRASLSEQGCTRSHAVADGASPDVVGPAHLPENFRDERAAVVIENRPARRAR